MAMKKTVIPPRKGKPVVKKGTGGPAPIVKAPKIGPITPKVKY